MRVMGIETSCDETGVALYDSERGLLADAVHSQVDLHADFGGVVPVCATGELRKERWLGHRVIERLSVAWRPARAA